MTPTSQRPQGLFVASPLVAVAWLLAACAPHVEAAGPPVAPPALAGDHVRTADGARLPLRVWRAGGEPEAVIVALHGFNDYSNAFAEPADYWAARGITTYAYDQRGFGETATRGLWPGTDTLAADLRAVAGLARAAHPEVPLYLLGESMGGAVVMTLMAGERPPAVDGLVLVAPAVWGWQTMNPFYQAGLWLGAHVVPWATVTGKGLVRPSDNRDMLMALARDPLTIKKTRIDAIYGLVTLMDEAFDAAPAMPAVPTLVLYGDNDELVPRGPTFDMLARLAAPHRFALYPTGYHLLLRDLEAEAPRADIAAWIENPRAPLPSGHERDAARVLARE